MANYGRYTPVTPTISEGFSDGTSGGIFLKHTALSPLAGPSEHISENFYDVWSLERSLAAPQSSPNGAVFDDHGDSGQGEAIITRNC
ncbi:hypothetical protein RRG08_066721 [Elysia crispata]|uniref:Uncharacterized protein n=1 Tax=Elysia crispata TaxID=231223 RepID=A0AAE1B9Z4_9GAST|nr:hypothetical protein RRG08_066721 [Elysia crispata]